MASETTKKRVAFQNSEDSPLAKFDDTEDDHVLDDAGKHGLSIPTLNTRGHLFAYACRTRTHTLPEQEKVVRDLKEHNDKANTIYRWLNLFILSLVAIL